MTNGWRSGSNNLVCGDEGALPSYGRFVAGFENETSARFATKPTSNAPRPKPSSAW
jgi:hypothetical protein